MVSFTAIKIRMQRAVKILETLIFKAIYSCKVIKFCFYACESDILYNV
jgi:hypothetical protein